MARATTKITVTLPSELVEAMEQRREQTSESRSAFVRRALEARLAGDGALSTPPPATARPRAATWGEFLELLKELPRPDPDFLSDLEAIRDEAGKVPLEDTLERFSTRKS